MMPVSLPDAAALSQSTRKLLAKRQARANALPAGQIDADWTSFRRTKSSDEVALALSNAFHGKCAYCEQESAKDIEHFYPKSRHPDRMYVWTNFLWSCKNCNTEKLAVFPLTAAGEPTLLNPTQDEPLDYFRWNEVSGKIIPHLDPARGERASQTRDLLELDQFALAEERRSKLANVVYLLSRVVSEDPVQEDTRHRVREELAPHRPWLGIVRQLFRHRSPKYAPLVGAAQVKLPELTELIMAWLDASHSPE
jgi:uncharacterized protein (TIGR02646 family)